MNLSFTLFKANQLSNTPKLLQFLPIEKLEMKPCVNTSLLTLYTRFRASQDFTFKAVRNNKPVTGRWCSSLGHVESKTLEPHPQ